METFVKGSKLEGQKYAVGQRVHIAEDLGPSMSHFTSGEDVTVMYSYGQSCGGKNVDSYGVMFDNGNTSAWYHEHQLAAIDDSMMDKSKEILTIMKSSFRDIAHTIRK